MWEGSREALAPLELHRRERILESGAGTGEFTRILREEATAPVVALDADRTLLATVQPPTIVGDATRLPLTAGAVDLAVCQALLVNLPSPTTAVREFSRVSSELVGAIEPDNSDVRIESSVARESRLARRARRSYLAGVETNAALGGAADMFRDAGLRDVRVTRYEHVRTIEPPYDESDVRAARRMATGAGLADDRPQLIAGGLSHEEYDRLRAAWRSMGRSVVEQMQSGEYRRREVVPFFVTVGHVV